MYISVGHDNMIFLCGPNYDVVHHFVVFVKNCYIVYLKTQSLFCHDKKHKRT